MKPPLSLICTTVILFLTIDQGRSEVAVFTDSFNSYTAGGPLPTGGFWNSASNIAPFSATIQLDANNLFAEGSTNKYLRLQSLSNSTDEYQITASSISVLRTTGNISFNFYQPTVANAAGDGFILRIGNGYGGNSQTAFGLGLKNGGLYLGTTSNVVLNPTSFATYALDFRHTLTIYFNNKGSALYLYTVAGLVHTLAPRTMDVWLDGTLVGNNLSSCGGVGSDVSLNEFNFVSRANFIGTLYVDKISEKMLSGSAPSAPSNITAVGIGSQMSLTWTAVNGATAYTVASADIGGGLYTVLETTGTNAAIDMPAVSGTYYYIVCATNSSDTGPYSSPVAGTLAVPNQVTDLVAAAPSSTGQINLSWTAAGSPFPATRYNVKRSSTDGGPYTTIASVATASYTDSGLSNNTPYYYVVSGVNANGEGDDSSQAAMATMTVYSTITENFDSYLADLPPPSGIGQIWNTTTNTSPFVALVQTDTNNLFGNGVSGKYLKMAVTANSSSSPLYSLNPHPIGGIAGSVSFDFYQPSVTGASGDGFVLRIGNGTGSSANTAFAIGMKNGGLYKATGAGVTLGSSPFFTYTLNARHALTVVFNDNLTKTYQYPMGSYVFTLAPQSADVWLDGARVGGTLPTCGSLGPNTAIVNLNFTSNAGFVGALFVDNLSFKAVPLVQPAAPTGLSATVSGNRVNLTWMPAAGAISYNLRRSTTSGGPYTTVNSWIAGNTSYVDIPSLPGTYYYVVAATNTSTNGPDSNQVPTVVSTPTGVPSAIIGVNATAGTSQNILNWSPVFGSPYATSYNVKRSTTSGGPFTVVASATTLTSFVDTGLTNGTIYYYVVSGINSSGEGPNSTIVSATPTLAPTDGTTSFASSWQLDPVKGGWFSAQVTAPSRLQRDITTATWHGVSSARVEVRPGDNPINSTGERSEISFLMSSSGTKIYEDGSSGTVFYAMSYMLPPNWQNISQVGAADWAIVLQLHSLLVGSPCLTLYANSKYQLDINGGDLDTGAGGVNSTRGASAILCNFTDGGWLNLGMWTDFVVKVVYSQNATGSVTVWRRDEGEVAFTQVLSRNGIPTLQYRSSVSGTAGQHYWKEGFYRGRHSPTITNVFWMGPFVRGTSFKAVEWAAFGTAIGAP